MHDREAHIGYLIGSRRINSLTRLNKKAGYRHERTPIRASVQLSRHRGRLPMYHEQQRKTRAA